MYMGVRRNAFDGIMASFIVLFPCCYASSSGLRVIVVGEEVMICCAESFLSCVRSLGGHWEVVYSHQLHLMIPDAAFMSKDLS